MSFGNIIKKLRLDKKMTQEQLAEVLSISPQAISRWETNIALPDISLLPILANYFDVTTDYLLEVDISKREQEIDNWLNKARAYTSKGYWSNGIDVLREAIKKYPSSYKLINELAYALFCLPQETGSYICDDRYIELREEIISLEETVLDNSKDTELRHSAISLLCKVYGILNLTDKAEALAGTMPSIYSCKEELLASLLKGTKRFKQQQDNIFSYLELLLMKLSYNNAPLDDGARAYTAEEMILLNEKVIDILNVVFEYKNYGFFAQKVAWTYLDIAWFYASLRDKIHTIKYLELAKEQAIKNDGTPYNPDDKYTCLIFKEKPFGERWNNITSNDSQHQLEEMDDKVYDFIRDNDKFKAIQEELTVFAKK